MRHLPAYLTLNQPSGDPPTQPLTTIREIFLTYFLPVVSGSEQISRKLETRGPVFPRALLDLNIQAAHFCGHLSAVL